MIEIETWIDYNYWVMNNKDSESRIRGSDYQSEAEHNGKSTISRHFYVI